MEFNKYPYTDFHELNLDWVIEQIRMLHVEWSDFKILNSIRFDGQWDITKQYPAWTLVNNNNLGYISKKPVPAGIALDNTEYWGLVADYSALLADMQNRIVIAEHNINNIKNDISILKNRHYLFIGDSYAEGNYFWKHIQQKGWCYYVADYLNLGDRAHYAVHGGTGFVGNEGMKTFGDVALEYEGNKEEITDIVICGGFNDKSRSGVSAAMRDQIASIKNAYPNATIWIGFIGWRVDMYDNTLRAMATIYNDTAVSMGCNIFKNSQLVLHNYMSDNSSYFDRDHEYDYFHPNDRGEVALAKYITSCLCCSEYMPSISGSSKIGDYTFINSLVDGSYPDLLRCVANNVEIPLTPTTVTCNGINHITIGNISGGFVIGAFDTAFDAHIVLHGASRFYECVAKCQINSGVVTVTPAILNSAGNAWVNDTFDQIRFLSNTFNLNRVYC